MTSKIEALYTQTIEKLSDEAAFASKMIKHFSRIDITDTSFKVIPTDARYERWSEYRLAILRDLRVLRTWTVEDFRIAFHNNDYGLQTLVYAPVRSAYWQ